MYTEFIDTYDDILSQKEMAILKMKPFNNIFSDEDKHLNNLYLENSLYLNLYSYQKFLPRYFNLFTGIKRLILKWATGSGKTKGSLAVCNQFLEDGGKEIFIIGRTSDNFLHELIHEPKFGFTNKEMLKELNILRNYDEQKYNLEINRIKKFIKKKGYTFVGFEKLFNEVFIFPLDYVQVNNLTYEDLLQMIDDGKIVINKNMFDRFKNSLFVIDEFHNLYNSKNKNNQGLVVKYILDTLKEDLYVILLSATIINNNPVEILDAASLIDYSFNPIKTDYFDISDKISIPLKGTMAKLFSIFNGKVSYYESKTRALYPEQIFVGERIKNIPFLKIVKCPMTGYQLKFFKEVYDGDVIPAEANNISDVVVPEGYKINDIKKTKHFNLKQTNNFTTISMKNPEGFSSKAVKLLELLEVSKGKKLIYHKDVNIGGSSFYAEVLFQNGYTPYGTFSNSNAKCLYCKNLMNDKHEGHEFHSIFYFFVSGNTSDDLRNKIYNIYSSPENKEGKLMNILVGSRIVEESIDIKALRHMFILSPPKNIGRYIQLLGRGVRSGSHMLLNENDRNIKIYTFVSNEYEEKIYSIMMEKYSVIKNINEMLDRASIDLYLNENIILPETSIFSDNKINHGRKVSSKIKEDFYKIKYREEDLDNIRSLIITLFSIYPVWKNDDLKKKIKDNRIITGFNTELLDDKDIEEVIHDIIDNPFKNNIIKNYGDYLIFMKKNDVSNYNFLSDNISFNNKVSINELLDVIKNYDDLFTEYYKINKNKKILDMCIDESFADKRFYAKLCENCIEYVFGLLNGKKISEYHDFYLKILYFFDKLGLLIYSTLLDLDYSEYISKTGSLNDVKINFYTSLENSFSKDPTFNRFNIFLEKKKIPSDQLPVGHLIDTIPKVYFKEKWINTSFKYSSKKYKENNIVVGYLEKGNSIQLDFKLKFQDESELNVIDKRKLQRGIKCSSIKKKKIFKLLDDLNIKYDEAKNLNCLCDLIKMELFRREINDPTTKWIYMSFE